MLRWLTVNGDDGRLLDRNPKTWRIPRDVQAFADAAYVTSVGPCSAVPAERCDGEHLIRHPDGRIEWTTPLGQTIIVDPFDYRLGP